MTHQSTINKDNLSFRHAKPQDAELVADLVNSAYRGDSSRAGWTTEADLVEGARTSQNEIIELIEPNDSMLFLCIQQGSIVGSVHMQKKGNTAHLGMFVIQPTLQGAGIGKQFMQASETEAQKVWSITKVTMSVISIRDELIAFYERRGYKRTGEFTPFPTDAGESVPIQENIQFETMEKELD